jgi:hypothetical protein
MIHDPGLQVFVKIAVIMSWLHNLLMNTLIIGGIVVINYVKIMRKVNKMGTWNRCLIGLR